MHSSNFDYTQNEEYNSSNGSNSDGDYKGSEDGGDGDDEQWTEVRRSSRDSTAPSIFPEPEQAAFFQAVDGYHTMESGAMS